MVCENIINDHMVYAPQPFTLLTQLAKSVVVILLVLHTCTLDTVQRFVSGGYREENAFTVRGVYDNGTGSTDYFSGWVDPVGNLRVGYRVGETVEGRDSDDR